MLVTLKGRPAARLIGLSLLGLSLVRSSPAYSQPFIPRSDTEVLERLTTRSDPQTNELRRLRQALVYDPHNLQIALTLATQYLEKGRAEGDPRYQGYAQAVLRPWWHQTEPPAHVLVLRATVRQNRHDFSGALEDLARVLSVQPRNAQAWLTQAVILEVRGDYAAARDSCRRLSSLSHSLVAKACLASAASLSGQAEKSYQFLRQAVHRDSSSPVRGRLWALTVLAEIAVRLGRDTAAEQHFQQAQALGLRDIYLLGAWADFLLDQNRPEEVRVLLEQDIRPDALLLRLILAEKRLGAPQLEEHVENLRSRYAATRLRGDATHLGSEARFTLHVLNQPVEALALAQRNWAIQREPTDSRLVLEAALAANDPEAAGPVLEWLGQTGLQDVRLADLAQQLRAHQ